MGQYGICWCFGIVVGQLALGRVELNATWQQVDSCEIVYSSSWFKIRGKACPTAMPSHRGEW